MIGILRLARPADWVKNGFVFPALIASGKGQDPESLWLAVIAFFAFSFISSGVYCINDALDWRTDAGHPVKRRRPIPSGEVTPTAGFVCGAVWIAVGLVLSLTTVGWPLAAVLISYLCLQAAYNVILKRIATVDVVTLSLGFVLRAMAGAVAIDVPASLWLLISVFFLCLYLAEIKRLCDLSSVRMAELRNTNNDKDPVEHDDEADEPKASLGSILPKAAPDHQRIPWRPAAGYATVDELNWMLAVSAALAVLTFLLYSLTGHASRVVGPGAAGFAILTPIVVIGMFRFYRAALHGRSDSPLAIACSDPILIICGLFFAAGSVLFLYVPWIEKLIERLFGTFV